MKDITSNQGAGKANSKLKVKVLQGPIEVRKLVWSPAFSCVLLFVLISHFVPCFEETQAHYPPIWSTLQMTQIESVLAFKV
jgi:hypothetical protein